VAFGTVHLRALVNVVCKLLSASQGGLYSIIWVGYIDLFVTAVCVAHLGVGS
jgi:hypothetical protein